MQNRTRTEYACLLAAMAERECAPTFTLDRQIEQARREMGEARWQQLQAEWSKPNA